MRKIPERTPEGWTCRNYRILPTLARDRVVVMQGENLEQMISELREQAKACVVVGGNFWTLELRLSTRTMEP